MTTHITLRLAWHNDGWNGRICEKPAENSYCVGCSSYPGEVIRERRDLEWEKKNAGKKIVDLEKPPACMYSASTFAEDGNQVESEPPDFFNDGAQVAKWYAPPATACTWPYEAMYRDEARSGGRYDAEKRIAYANEHFDAIEPNSSLVFYYANYSNPFSEDDAKHYVLVGVARIKEKGDTIYFDGCDERTMERYGGFVWQRNITSHYPDQGLRLPYHRYRNQPDVLEQFVVLPEATHLCKYASKHVSDDQALGLLEQVIEAVRALRDDVQDDSEDWSKRLHWLEGLVAELWSSRGAYPGMPAVLNHLGLAEAIDSFRAAVEASKEKEIVAEIRAFCEGNGEQIGDYLPLAEERRQAIRDIQLNAGDELEFLLEGLARCSISIEQLRNIMTDLQREDSPPQWGVSASLDDVQNNLYLLSEQYLGKDEGDLIRWSTVDRGAIPSPELGVPALFSNNAPERVRALMLETLRSNSQQTFVKAEVLLEQVNRRVQAQPEWKQNLLSLRYLKVDAEFLVGALYLREEDKTVYIYDRVIWNEERAVQAVLDDRLAAPTISLKRPVTEDFWQTVLFDQTSQLAESARAEYQTAIDGQKSACAAIFGEPLAVLTGGAGTGKSTVVAALIRGIRKAHGDGVSVAVLAPTGKATDRLRRVMGESTDFDCVSTATIHSLLARHGWLNKNMTFRSFGGKSVNQFNALIIDESSMIDLKLMAALFRAVDWNSIQRLILVGDPAQLPPIGVGKVYADLVSYVRNFHAENLADLKDNLRQLQNRVSGRGNGILELAACFLNKAVLPESRTPDEKRQREEVLQRLHEGGEFSKDLWIEYWEDSEQLADKLIKQITADLSEPNEEREPSRIWSDVLDAKVDAFQILSPVRGELYGVDSINDACQQFKSSYWLSKGALDSITLYDKVIQFRNRNPVSNPIYAYDHESREGRKVEVYNGELGMVKPHPFDYKKLKARFFYLQHFSVKFAGKDHLSVNYGSGLGKGPNGRWLPREKPEENLELAYAISVHKSQGSEFERVYLVLPSGRISRQDMELLYTALTRASGHCTVFIQDSVKTILDAMRPEQSALLSINSSLFEFRAVPDELLQKADWYEAGKIHKALTGDMVCSKSEVIIANILFERGVDFRYETQLVADDGSMYLPDFTIKWRGEDYYWEHVGMLHDAKYSEHWEKKKAWYEKHFPSRLLVTEESETLSNDAAEVIAANFV